MKKRFRFVGTYLFDGDEVVGTIKDNETTYLIEELLNSLEEENKSLKEDLGFIDMELEEMEDLDE